MNGIGIAAGLGTAVLWTATSICFEISGRQLGSGTLNLLRLAVAAVLFIALSLVRSGTCMPQHLTLVMWAYLALSGVIGFVIGDLMLFRAFVLIGARRSMLIYASVPVMTALAGLLCLGESIDRRSLFGMAITILGIATAILAKPPESVPVVSNQRRQGVLLAVGASAGQTAGFLLSKQGSIGLDSFAATEIRVLAALAGILVLVLATGQTTTIADLLRRTFSPSQSFGSEQRELTKPLRTAFTWMVAGSVLGPFLGVSLGLRSLQLLPAGVASTFTSIVPVLLIPVSAVVFREVVTRREVLGTFIAIAGVGILAYQ